MNRYADIIDLPHHVNAYRRPMSLERRAAQFAPFAALTGYDDAIAETAMAHVIMWSQNQSAFSTRTNKSAVI